jgi:hypothetical protein
MVKLIDLSRLNELLRPVRVNDGGGFQPAPEQIHQGSNLEQVEARVKVEHKGREARKSWLNLSLNLISVGRWSRHPRLPLARLDGMRRRRESPSDTPEGSFSIGLCRARE